jgi:Pyridoxamine 5'-phosphate oxidase
MAKFYTKLNESLRQFIAAQRIFFNASAPNQGRINISPKGLDTFRVLSDRRVAYLDLTGSGVETVAHLRENGRITLLFCAFAGPHRVLRLYGRGRAVEPGDAGWEGLVGQFPEQSGARSVIVVELERVADSCGYGGPRFEFVGPRTQLPAWAEQKGAEGVARYRRRNNRASIDGLPGLHGEG